MKKFLVVVSCLVAAVSMSSVALAGEMVDNPTYQDWARFKPGTTVEYKTVQEMTIQGMPPTKTESTMTWTLIEVTDEKVVVEMKASSGGYEMPAQKLEHPAKVEKTEPVEGEQPKFEVQTGTETIEAAGKSFDCDWTESTVEVSGTKTTSRTWMSKEIPNGMVKSVSKTEGAVSMTNETILAKVEIQN